MREVILAAARDVFCEVGYNAAAMVRIAVLAGVSYSKLITAFPDKEALLRELLSRRDDEDEERIDLDAITDPHDALDAVVGLVRFNSTHPGIVELFTVLAGESVSVNNPGHEFFAGRYESRLSTLRRTYTRGREAGLLDSRLTPDAAAAELIALMDGLQIQWLLSGGRTDMVALVRGYLNRQLIEPT
ncbi:TetR/AcrR family transcriptional regulator [Gryllotalpicola reticulitermitis]|uniref:TetR/AcrR family transcriptional regulator n=1 Tax=Gryllotalpicola reticulitermitis TaxID=1184153 RepID=A0ABV8QAM8_9MICO